jgi:hypothetical protein
MHDTALGVRFGSYSLVAPDNSINAGRSCCIHISHVVVWREAGRRHRELLLREYQKSQGIRHKVYAAYWYLQQERKTINA